MLAIDLHAHTLSSRCGVHTHWEVMQIARERGIRMIALTDHGPALESALRNTFLREDRFPREWNGLTVLKGLEANVMGLEGDLDASPDLVAKLDILLVGLHVCSLAPGDVESNTRAVLALLDKHPDIDIITHPDIATYVLDYERVVPAAAERGVAFEINDANIALGKTDFDAARRMIELGHEHGALFALNSDGHTFIEFGRDENARRWLEDIDAPSIDIINDWPLERVREHLAERKRRRDARRN